MRLHPDALLSRLADHAEAEAQRGRDTVHGPLEVERPASNSYYDFAPLPKAVFGRLRMSQAESVNALGVRF